MHQKASRLYISQSTFLFHCHIKVKIPVEYGQELLDRSFALLADIDKSYNAYVAGSSFDRINRAAGQWISVDEETIRLLQQAQQVSAATEGSYALAIMPLLRLWGFYDTIGFQKLPKQQDIQHVVDSMQKYRIEIEGLSIRINADMELMTGSFIKAYAVDKLVTFLRQEGVTAALINAGGSTIAAINDCEQPFWRIRLPHPHHADCPWEELLLCDESFSLSGNRDHTLLKDGKHYGHILNAKTGWPSTNWQTGVRCASAFWSDILSTALLTVAPQDYPRIRENLHCLHPFKDYFIAQDWGNQRPDFFTTSF